MRTTLPGEPSTSEPSGMALPSVTMAPAPMRQFFPTTARLRMMAPMPISEFSPMVQPCSITRWPTLTFFASVTGTPPSVWMTLPSCTLTFSPSVITSLSPRMVTFHHTLALASSTTEPITAALCATKYSPRNTGLRSPSW